MDIQEILKSAVDEAEQEAVTTTSKTRLIDVFRGNYDDWNERLFPAWKKVGKVCHRELALLLNQVGFSTVNPALVGRYMKLVRDERKSVGKPGVGTHHLKPLKKPVPISRATSAAVAHDGLDVHHWADPSWLGDEPNWGDLLAPGADRPRAGDDWNSHWENVWRWLYRLADSHGLNSFDRTVYAGFKKISASVGDLWLDLSKVRRLMNTEGTLLDPKGVGTKSV
jgi:hypothetical protein